MPRLALTILGSFQITLDGRPAIGFESSKVRALLAYLAVEADSPHSRDALIGLLWPDKPQQAARTNLSQALANLRQAIGDRTAQPPFLLIDSNTIQFNRQSDHWLDLRHFEALLAACDRHPHRGKEKCHSCIRRMEEVAGLYQGEFLEGYSIENCPAFEEWVLMKREQLQQLALEALSRLAGYYDRLGQHGQSYGYARRQLDIDPWREEAHRQAMRALALSGERSAALEQYGRCRHVLRDELGVEPARETTELYERIRTGLTRADVFGRRARPLPIPPTSLVGRQAEMAELSAWIEDPARRLITIVGPGGIGKTRLALAIASAEAETFADGAAFIALDSLDSADWLPVAIVQALGIPLEGQADPRSQLLAYLADKELLLVLDNMEHLLDGVGLLAEIGQQATRTVLVVTSRERLNLAAEWLFDVGSLDYPPDESAPVVEQYGAVQLFVQRATQAQRNFHLGQKAHIVARICKLVEGLPLAIELAAATASQYSLAQIAAELERNMQALATRKRDLPKRQQSILATFEYSWNFLSEEERQVASRLSVFRGRFDAEASQQVAGAKAEVLSALVDKSWLRPDGTGGYDMHVLVRRYMTEKLVTAGEAEAQRAKHLDYLLALVEAAHLREHTADEPDWLMRVVNMQDDVRAALSWSIEQVEIDPALRLGGGMGRFWEMSGDWREGRQWMAQILKMSHSFEFSAGQRGWYARALFHAGLLAWRQGDYAAAHELLEQSLALQQGLNNRHEIAEILDHLGGVWYEQGDYRSAQTVYERSLALWRELDYRPGLAGALTNLGLALLAQGDWTHARSLCEQSQTLFREAGDKYGMSYALNLMGNILYAAGDFARAMLAYEDSLAVRQDLGNKRGIAATLTDRANLKACLGQYAAAQTDYTNSMRLFGELGNNRGLATALAGLARIAFLTGHFQLATRLLGFVEAFLILIQARLDEPANSENERALVALRCQLDETSFNAAWSEGRAMTLENAIAHARTS